MPGELSGLQVPLAVRLMQVAQDADLAWQHGGTALVRSTLAGRAGSGLDPQLVSVFLSAGGRLFDGLDAPSVWDDAMAAEPGPQPVVTGPRLDACLSAIADFADLKTHVDGRSFPWRRRPRRAGRHRGRAGRPRGADAAPGRAGARHRTRRGSRQRLGQARPAGPRRARAGPAARLPQRAGARGLPGLHPLARLAGSHGERSDGSGYHRGSRSGDLPAASWLLAAADCYQAMREPRAYRPARSAQAAADELCRDAAAGKLPAEAVQAVLTAAGQPPRPVPRPAGLSERECEVLSLIARGMATKQVARQLGISPKTCDHHIQRLYRKTGLSTRAGATLFALEHGLIPPG